MKLIKIFSKTILVAWVSLCLMGLIATSCRTVDKSVQGVELVQVSGTALGDNNEPLIGGGVQQNNNPKNAVITDIDGHFTIYVPAGDLLRVCYEGYYDNVIEAKDGMTIILNHNPNYKKPSFIVK